MTFFDVVLLWVLASLPVSILIGRLLSIISTAYPEAVEVTTVSPQ